MSIEKRRAKGIDYRALLEEPAAWPRVLGIITCKILRKEGAPYGERFKDVIDTIATNRFASSWSGTNSMSSRHSDREPGRVRLLPRHSLLQ
jgi:hypothetical protein